MDSDQTLVGTKKNLIFIFITSIINSLVLMGCINGGDSGGGGATTAASSTTTSSTIPVTTAKDFGFSGVRAVVAIGSTALKIQWTLATNTSVLGYRIYERTAEGTMTAIAEVPSSATSFNHSPLTPGSFHNYVVRAFDATDNDGNSTFKGNSPFSGVTSVSITGTTTATINFSSAGSFADAVNVYGTSRGVTTLLGTATSSATSFAATGLKSGATYTFTSKVSSSGIEYENLASQTAQTTSNTSTKYKGVIAVQAYGDAPSAPTGTPQARKTVITWDAFTGATSLTHYSLVRTGRGNTFDTTMTTACTNTTTTSCQVCTATGTGAKTCEDTNVATSPQVYDYAVVLVPTPGWPEELPASDSGYRITVPIPPSNMVLVQRGAANYEMCQLMGLPSDALNHQRCVYTGIGAAPYSTGPNASPLNMSAGYYDFGYNLFVDRWVAACNWTPQASGGMCGAGATAGNCFGNATPAGTLGVTGNVFYNTHSGNCLYRQSGGWVSINSGSLTTGERQAMYTIDPGAMGGKRPPLAYIDQNNSYGTCQAIVDPDYGAKRLMRKREFVVAAASPWLTGEPGQLTDAAIGTLESGTAGHGAGVYSCNSSTHSGVAEGAFTTHELAGDAVGVIDSFIIGSLATSKCVSRFGMQDFVGNVYQWTSDQLSCNSVSHTCSGTSSALDSGNGYSPGYDMNGFLFNGTQGPGGTGAGQVATGYTDTWTLQNGVTAGTGAAQGYGAGYFSVPLGLPMVGNDGGNAVTNASFLNKIHGDNIAVYTSTGVSTRGLVVGNFYFGSSVTGRWWSSWAIAPTVTNGNYSFRCALPAE